MGFIKKGDFMTTSATNSLLQPTIICLQRYDGTTAGVKHLAVELALIAGKIHVDLPAQIEKAIVNLDSKMFKNSTLNAIGKINWINECISNVTKVLNRKEINMKWDAVGIEIFLEMSELSSEDQGKYAQLLAGLPMIQDAITQVKIYERAQEGKVDKSAASDKKDEGKV